MTNPEQLEEPEETSTSDTKPVQFLLSRPVIKAIKQHKKQTGMTQSAIADFAFREYLGQRGHVIAAIK